MNLEDGAQVLWGIGALVLAISALAARRPSRGTIARSLLAWVLIGALILLATLGVHYLGDTTERPREVPNASSAPVQYSAVS
ncbi:hypothetical protein GGQ81_001276 [Sphingomonas desiccabilis]|nr:hypothetical protein [Sphingomonas desiccabilis]